MKVHNVLLASLLALCWQLAPGQTTPPRRDSVVVNFGGKTRMVITSEAPDSLRRLLKYDFTAILRDLEIFSEQAKDQNTAYLYLNESTGKRYLLDTTRRRTRVYIDIERRPNRPRINGQQPDRPDTIVVTPRPRLARRNYNGLYLDFGYNNYLQNGQMPARFDSPYGLRPTGSRYVALGLWRDTRIGGERSVLYLHYALEFSWYNFMLQGNNVATRTATGVEFRDFGQALEKSKLTVSYLSVPVMPTLRFRDHRGVRTWRLSAGGYLGVRLASYTKTKLEADGRKDHVRGDFFLSDIRYGLMARVGYKWVNLFAKYDLNPLFAERSGPTTTPNLRAFSVGVTLFGINGN